MKKLLLAAIAATGLLASCGDTASTGDASAKITDIKTEFRTSNGTYVACGNLLSNNQQFVPDNQVGVYFTANGSISSVNIALVGNTSNQTNGYVATASGTQLQSLGTDRFKVIFDAKADGAMLPQSIVVNPVARYVKIVSVENYVGLFHAELTLNTPSGSATATTQYLSNGNIPIYANCYFVSETTETL